MRAAWRSTGEFIGFRGGRYMGKLYFEDIVDVNTPYPYVFVYMLPEGETFNPSTFAPFMDLAIQGRPRPRSRGAAKRSFPRVTLAKRPF